MCPNRHIHLGQAAGQILASPLVTTRHRRIHEKTSAVSLPLAQGGATEDPRRRDRSHGSLDRGPASRAPIYDLIPSTSALSSALLLDIGFAILNKYCTIDNLSEYPLPSLSSCWYRVGTHIAAMQKKVSFDTTLADRGHVNHPLNESLFIRSKSRSIQLGLIISIRARVGSQKVA